MNFADIQESFIKPKGRFFKLILILLVCMVVNVFFELNERFFYLSGIFSYNSVWYQIIVILSLVFSLSIFLVSYYTYPQTKNVRLLIAGFTFLTVGLIDCLNLLISSGLIPFTQGTGDQNKTLLMWFISRFIIVTGFSLIVSIEAQYSKLLKRRYLFFLSMLAVAVTFSYVYFFPLKPELFTNGIGLNNSGLILITLITLLYIYSMVRSVKEFKKNDDILYKVLSVTFLLMFFSNISMMQIHRIYDIWSVLSHLYQFVSYVLLLKVFYVHGIQRPYILLSQAKGELNDYLLELDRLVDKRTIELKGINEKLLADQEIARGIQQSMLPSILPRNEFVAFSSGYVPAENLSGDFYNVFKIDETRFGICIGDVSGHGVSAAMLSIFTFQKMQSLMEETGGEGMAIPSLVLKHLYDSFNSANFSEDMYIVMLYGVLNTQTGIFSYASGGLNTTPLRIRPDGSIQELDNDGFAICKLGDLLKPKFVNHQILLFPGDKLVLYTDGLTDARNKDNEEYSLKRLKNTILRHYKWGVDYLADAIVRDVKSHAAESPADDITVVAVDVLPPF